MEDLSFRSIRGRERLLCTVGFLLLVAATHPASAQLDSEPELPTNYWMAGVWRLPEAECELETCVVFPEFDVSKESFDGYLVNSVQSYRREGAKISYEAEGRALALWDLETYEVGGERRYGAVWKEAPNRLSYTNLGTPFTDRRCLTQSGRDSEPPLDGEDCPGLPDGPSELVDFECYEEDGEPQFIGVWHDGSGSSLAIAPYSQNDLLALNSDREIIDIDNRDRAIIDIERCYWGSESKPYLVLRDTAGSASELTVGMSTSWDEFHEAYHESWKFDLLELEVIPSSATDGVAVAWDYIWAWSGGQDFGNPEKGWCNSDLDKEDAETNAKDSWLMVTDSWDLLQVEVGCRNHQRTMVDLDASASANDSECGGTPCHQELELVDLIVGLEPLETEDDSQHKPTHGDGPGGPPL